MNPTLKRHLISALITFLTAFLFVIATDLSVENLDQASLVALLITALRAGIKSLVEYLPTIK